jgi:hypothetical protein
MPVWTVTRPTRVLQSESEQGQSVTLRPVDQVPTCSAGQPCRRSTYRPVLQLRGTLHPQEAMPHARMHRLTIIRIRERQTSSERLDKLRLRALFHDYIPPPRNMAPKHLERNNGKVGRKTRRGSRRASSQKLRTRTTTSGQRMVQGIRGGDVTAHASGTR